MLIKQFSWSGLENRVTSFWGVESNKKIRRNKGESNYLWLTDIETLKRGEQTGLDTLVVHALTDECENIFWFESIALNTSTYYVCWKKDLF